MSESPASSTIRWEQDETGIVTLVLDDPDQSANTMNNAFKASLTAVADRLEAEKDSVRGIIFTSAKKTFFAGGDLRADRRHPRQGRAGLRGGQRHQARSAPY